MPPWSWLIASSRGEQSMPLDIDAADRPDRERLVEDRHARAGRGPRHEVARRPCCARRTTTSLSPVPSSTRARQSLSEFG